MKNFVLVGILFVLWFASMFFYMPLPVMVVLFAAVVSSATVVTWLHLMKRRGGQPQSVIKPDART